jgi:hypothetical protein
MPEVDINSEEALVSLMQGQDAVINLIGILHSRDVVLPYSKDFAEAHVELPKKIVAACKVGRRPSPGPHERARAPTPRVRRNTSAPRATARRS